MATKLSDETIDGLMFGAALASNPRITARREEYNRKVEAARVKARSMTKTEIIYALCEHTPSYIRDLLETEDARFGDGSLVERYARTFYDTAIT